MLKNKIMISITILTILVTLASCGKGTAAPDSEASLNAADNINSGENYDELPADTPADTTPETTDIPVGTMIDYLWSKLKGTWEFEEFLYMGKPTHSADGEHTMEFIYVDKVACIRKYTERDDVHFPDTLFYEADIIDEFHYYAYRYKKGAMAASGKTGETT